MTARGRWAGRDGQCCLFLVTSSPSSEQLMTFQACILTLNTLLIVLITDTTATRNPLSGQPLLPPRTDGQNLPTQDSKGRGLHQDLEFIATP